MTQSASAPLNEAFMVTRRIPLVLKPGGSLPALAGMLLEQPGIARAEVGSDGRLAVRYDASRIGFDEIERLLDEAAAERPTNLAWRIKSAWFRFTDDNACANAHATHACCSRPPVAPGPAHPTDKTTRS